MRSCKLDYQRNISPQAEYEQFQTREGKKQKTWEERQQLAADFSRLVDLVEEGIAILRSREDVFHAFLTTNEVFSRYYLGKGLPHAGWRIFQLVFFLTSIKSIVQHERLETATVLHVDTGGGKSEAYYAVIIFAALFDRASGKQSGVSSLVKFPLRMVSLDQLTRIANILMQAEIVREKYSDRFPGEQFSVGYFVGESRDFPNTYQAVKDRFLSENSGSSEGSVDSKEPLILSQCPLCGPENQGTVHFYDDCVRRTVVHKCDKCGKEFHIYISDREIFRWRPTVVVSTVDKWALLSSQRRVRNLLGGRGSFCPELHGFIPSGDECEDFKKEAFECHNKGEAMKNTGGPILSIQDEMHLLSEGFGTVSSHYEGVIESFIEGISKRKLKHFAMSATLNGTSNQIKELYNKKTLVIPGRCPDGIGSDNDLFFSRLEQPKRLIIGLKPNLRDNHYASLRTLLHLAQFLVLSQRSLDASPDIFCSEYGLCNSTQAQNLIKQFLVPLSYHLKKQDAYDMQRLMDEVVTEPLLTTSNTKIKPYVLTGDSQLDELKAAMDEVRRYVRDYNPEELRSGNQNFISLHATSVVSHGIDLDQLNFMVFQGLPYSTAEYIQALSRIGRKQLGIIFLWFYPNRVRDDSYYRNFIRYHDTLEHQVKPVPINRFSRLGLYQTFNSIFCASVINYLSNEKGSPLYAQKDVAGLTIEDQQQIQNFIQNAYGRDALDIDVPKQISDRFNQIINSVDDENKNFFPNILENSGDPFYRNQRGMRGIQKTLNLTLNSRGRNKLSRRR